MGCYDGALIICGENGHQRVVNAKMNSFHFKLCGSYNSDNFVVADFETIENFNISLVIFILILKKYYFLNDNVDQINE